MANKYKNMDEKELAHYIRHAVEHSEAWLQDKKQKKVDTIAHFNNCLDGGDVDLDEGRGTITLIGIKKWKYTDTDPSMGIPFAERFDTKEKFKTYQKKEEGYIDQSILDEQTRLQNYQNMIEVKGHIKKNKIIICKTEKEQNSTAGATDRKIKVKSGKQTVLIIVKNGI